MGLGSPLSRRSTQAGGRPFFCPQVPWVPRRPVPKGPKALPIRPGPLPWGPPGSGISQVIPGPVSKQPAPLHWPFGAAFPKRAPLRNRPAREIGSLYLAASCFPPHTMALMRILGKGQNPWPIPAPGPPL